jgi:hypothetical protein
MIYIVSGYMRTGTTMMMQALQAGGLETSYNPDRDKLLGQCGDEFYSMNPDSLMEIALHEYRQPGFPLQYEAKLIKVMQWGLVGLEPHAYRVVFMRRDPEEIRQSYEAAMGVKLGRGFQARYEKDTAHALRLVYNRRDVAVHECRYADVVADPLPIFQRLGWPIDCAAAAAVISPDRYRFQRSKLQEGA